jgi:hypothetical protein
LSDLTAHIKSPARAEHPSVPSDSHMDISSSSQSSENSLDQLLSSEHIKKLFKKIYNNNNNNININN